MERDHKDKICIWNIINRDVAIDNMIKKYLPTSIGRPAYKV